MLLGCKTKMLFRKLVSGLPYSPTLLGQLGIYARKIQERLTLRRAGLLFVVLAIIVQLFVLLKPPKASNTANTQNITPTLISSKDGLLKASSRKPTAYSFPTGVFGYYTINNLTDARRSLIQPGDRLQYNISVRNTTSRTVRLSFSWAMGGLLDYSTIYGAPDNTSFNPSSQTLTWNNFAVAGHQTLTSQVIILVDNRVPSTLRPSTTSALYDCSLSSAFGNSSTNLSLACPLTKRVEDASSKLPLINGGLNFVILFIALTLVVYLEARDQQIRQELRLIRKEFNNGAI